MTRPRFLGPCPTTWSYGGWRAWYDRILYGHVGHHCNQHDHERGHHTCDCGARLHCLEWNTTPLATPTPGRCTSCRHDYDVDPGPDCTTPERHDHPR